VQTPVTNKSFITLKVLYGKLLALSANIIDQAVKDLEEQTL
jgi:hypothetical protein